MKRRDLLRTMGAATTLSLVHGEAESAWARVLSGYRPAGGLTEAQADLVSVFADAMIPRTDTPGATDVGVPAWVNLIVAEYYDDTDRAQFRDGLAAIDARARAEGGVPYAALAPEARTRVMTALDQPADREAAEAKGYAQLKRLVVHGYFTSERVQKDVLRAQVSYPRFDGAAPFTPGRPR